jgi:hypothetical protein
MKKKREYLRLLQKSIQAMEESVAAFNGVRRLYKVEQSLILMTNGWELLAKAVLVKNHHSIVQDRLGNTISAEVAVSRLKPLSLLNDDQDDCIQQIISLRNHATHNVLPEVPEEILHHLMFFGCKFFRDIVGKVFPAYSRAMRENYLSLAFSDLTTYADRVQKLVAKVKRGDEQKKLVWLLERGVKFDGLKYISQEEFEAQYRRRRRILPHLALSDFLKKAEMVRIVAIQAPRNFTADVLLRRGSRADATLPVAIKKTDVEADYPYLTREIAERLGKNSNFASATIKFLGIKGNGQFHQSVRASKNSVVHRYSEAALQKIKDYLSKNPNFNPYAELKKMQGKSNASGANRNSLIAERAARESVREDGEPRREVPPLLKSA